MGLRVSTVLTFTALVVSLVGCKQLPSTAGTEPAECPKVAEVLAAECPSYQQEEPVACPIIDYGVCREFCPPAKPCPKVTCPVCPPALDKPIIGQIERVKLPAAELTYDARIDTGAETTSLHAENILMFERDGDRWVKFSLLNEKTNELIELERLRERKVRIKVDEGEYDRRPVIKMNLMIGGKSLQVEVNLTDRSNMEFPLLIGRNVLTDNFVVDVSTEYRLSPDK